LGRTTEWGKGRFPAEPPLALQAPGPRQKHVAQMSASSARTGERERIEVSSAMSLACGTLSYRQAPLERALEGIRRAGFTSVELGCVCGYCEHVRPEEMASPDVERLSKLLRQFDLEVISLAGHVDLQYPLLDNGPEVA